MKKSRAAVVAVLFAAASSASAATTQYWDVNGAAAGLGGSGSWDAGVTANWNVQSGTGDPEFWSDGNDAVFGGATAGAVTIVSGETRTAGSITFSNTAGNYDITGGSALDLTNAGGSILMMTGGAAGTAPRTQTISANISGGDLTVANNNSALARTQLSLTGTNTFTGDLILAGSSTGTASNNGNFVAINSAGALPSTAEVKFQRNFSQLHFGTSAPLNATFANNINLNSSGSGTFTSSIAPAGGIVTLSGVISGSANLAFQLGLSGGSGTVVLANNATYTGNTNMILQTNSTLCGIVRLGVDNALPQTTTLSFGTAGAQPTGAFDLAGFNQRIGALVNGTTAPGSIGGIVNTSNTLSTLTIEGGGLSTTYAGTIGIPPVAVTTAVTGATNNIALQIGANHLGTLNLNAAAGNTYNGGTTVNGGTLLVSNTSNSGTGTGSVTIGAAGRFGSGTIGGSVSGLVDNSGTLVPGGVNAIGTLATAGGLTARTGSNINLEFNSSSNDTMTLGGATDADILNAPDGAQSVNLNLLDLGSGIANNTTYTLFNYPNTTELPGLDLTATGPLKVSIPQGVASLATLTLSNDTVNHQIKVAVSGTFGNRTTWRGEGSGNGTWDINTTQNFINNADNAAIVYNNPDEVTFDDTANPGVGTDPITVTIDPGGVAPGKISVNNVNRPYTFTGGISGTTRIVKVGGGTLVLKGTNTFTGGVTAGALTTGLGGILAIESDASLGAVPASPAVNLTLMKPSGGLTLRFDGPTTLHANRTIVISQNGGGGPTIDTAGADVTINGNITAANGANLLKAGTGTLSLRGDNSTNAGGAYIATIVVTGGTVNVDATAGLGRHISTGGATNLTIGGTGVAPTFQLGGSFAWNGGNITMSASGGSFDTNGFDTNVTGNFAGAVAAAFNKKGAGTLTFSGAATHVGNANVTGGTLSLATNYTPASVSVDNATVEVAAGGGSNRVLKTATVTLLNGAKVDVQDNKLIVTADPNGAGTFTGSEYNGVSKLVRDGMNVDGNGVPQWNGSGIVTTQAAAAGASAATTLAVASAGDVGKTTFGNQSVTASDALVMYTYNGDANLSGNVDADDYFIIDSNYANSGSVFGFSKGDFNYDGVIDGDDFMLIDTGFTGQGAPISGAPAVEGVSAVPEPAGISLLALAAASLMRRRRRA